MSSEHAVPDSDRSWVRRDRGSCSNAEAWQELCHRLFVKHNSNIVVHVKPVKGDVYSSDQWQRKREKR